MSDVWGKTSVTVERAAEGSSEARRCGECQAVFSRAKGSTLTHRQVDDTVTCAPDAEVTTIERSNRWKR